MNVRNRFLCQIWRRLLIVQILLGMATTESQETNGAVSTISISTLSTITNPSPSPYIDSTGRHRPTTDARFTESISVTGLKNLVPTFLAQDVSGQSSATPINISASTNNDLGQSLVTDLIPSSAGRINGPIDLSTVSTGLNTPTSHLITTSAGKSNVADLGQSQAPLGTTLRPHADIVTQELPKKVKNNSSNQVDWIGSSSDKNDIFMWIGIGLGVVALAAVGFVRVLCWRRHQTRKNQPTSEIDMPEKVQRDDRSDSVISRFDEGVGSVSPDSQRGHEWEENRSNHTQSYAIIRTSNHIIVIRRTLGIDQLLQYERCGDPGAI